MYTICSFWLSFTLKLVSIYIFPSRSRKKSNTIGDQKSNGDEIGGFPGIILMKERYIFFFFPDERTPYRKLFWEKYTNFVLLSLQARAYVAWNFKTTRNTLKYFKDWFSVQLLRK